jgi:hypothetical protein
VVLICISLLGCRKEEPVKSVPPAPTLAPNDKISISGNVTLTLDVSKTYIVTCTSDIPEGAFVTIYLMDEFGSLLDVQEDVIQRSGKCVASFASADVNAQAKANKADSIFARVEFYPSATDQQISIQERFGAKGIKLSGDNVITDNAGASGIRMESPEYKLS